MAQLPSFLPPAPVLARATMRDCFCHLSGVSERDAIFFTNGSHKPVHVPLHELPHRIESISLALLCHKLTPEQASSLATERTTLREAQRFDTARRLA